MTLGTAADLVPIKDENRTLVHFGLNQMKSPSSIGLSKLLALAKLSNKVPSIGQLVFGVAPRINAAGRLGDANRSVKLLTTDNEDIASDLARELDEENKRRREIQDAVFEDALLKVNAEIDLSTDKAIVVWGKDWHPGVVGIVASKLKEEFHRPAIVISMKEHGLGTGSARSIRGLNLYDALTKVKSTLEGYGGHPMAAGLTVKEENCDSFRSSFVSIANECLSDDDLIPGITVEGELKLNDITPRFMDFLDKLSPFGPGNMRPKFFASNVEISGIPKVIGGGNHIRFTVRQNGTTYGAIGFNLSEHYQDLITGNPIDLAFVVEINEWQNRREIQLNVRDIKLTPNAH
jgi:single-stranded-DNA-specific exonuclease